MLNTQKLYNPPTQGICVLCGSYNTQILFPYITLVYTTEMVFTVRYGLQNIPYFMDSDKSYYFKKTWELSNKVTLSLPFPSNITSLLVFQG